MSLWDRMLITAAGLVGAAGILLGAAGSHLGRGDLARLASDFLLFHAAAALGAVALAPRFAGRALRIAASLLILGAVSFSGELSFVVFAQSHLLAALAPAGGLMLIAGWLVLAISPFLGRNPVKS